MSRMVRLIIVIMSLISWVAILVTITSCSSMKAKGIKVTYSVTDPNVITLEHYEASYETLFVDWERQGWTGTINGFGSVGSNRVRVESEGAEIAEDISEVFNPVK